MASVIAGAIAGIMAGIIAGVIASVIAGVITGIIVNKCYQYKHKKSTTTKHMSQWLAHTGQISEQSRQAGGPTRQEGLVNRCARFIC